LGNDVAQNREVGNVIDHVNSTSVCRRSTVSAKYRLGEVPFSGRFRRFRRQGIQALNRPDKPLFRMGNLQIRCTN
jgi:hypothetical protein